jgi:hypothetical protein
MADEDSEWFSVRCVFHWVDWEGEPYEERITLWQAASLDDAIELAEQEARRYESDTGVRYVGLAQAYALGVPELTGGTEIFSLLRDSDLTPDDYVTAFFATGREHQAE